MKKHYTSYQYGEAQVGTGEIVKFSCEPADTDSVKTFIEDHIRSLEMSVTHGTALSASTSANYSRYHLVQHKYAAGEDGFIEVIEIKNPPNERCPFVIYAYSVWGDCHFSEWSSVADAVNVWKKIWGDGHNRQAIKKDPKLKRFVECGPLTPWFYAVGEEVLHGDYTLPSGFEDDPVFRLGAKFAVPEEDGVRIKTCMGSRFYSGSRQDTHGQSTAEEWRWVYFDDGTTLQILKGDVLSCGDQAPRPLLDREAWVLEAMEQFQQLLSGKREGFQIKFADGSVFTGKLAKKGKAVPSSEGDYLVKVTHDGGNIRQGKVTDFKPSRECPDIVSYIMQRMKVARSVEKVEVLKYQPKKGGKKWAGAFFAPPFSEK